MNPHTSDPALAQPALPQAASAAGISGNPRNDCDQEGDTRGLPYDPVTPKKTVTVAVRYRLRGRGQRLH
jgi:hypothetical protein